MTELSDLLTAPADGVTTRTARVIAVKGRVLTVDIGGGIDIPCVDSCNPLPDQVVSILSNGTSMLAISAMNGAYKQATVTVTANATNTVTGVVNGVSKVITKMGAFTPAVGDTLPLIWAADGSAVWAGATPGAAYVPPPAGGGGTGGGGGVTTGTATYPATWAGTYNSDWTSGGLVGGGGAGAYFYGSGRFRELQGRTITGFRINLLRSSGSGSVPVYGNGQSGPSGSPPLSYSAGSVGTSGYSGLPVGLANYLIGGSGTGAIIISGFTGILRGLPYGTLQFDWRR